MTKEDSFAFTGVLLFISPFILFSSFADGFRVFTIEHGYISAGLKFAILATFGEVLGLRIRTGIWKVAKFGILPKMVIWFILGVLIKLAFVVFASGVPLALNQLVYSPNQLVTAVSISVVMNLFFAPLFMTAHKVTDIHIDKHKGAISSLFIPIDIADILNKIDWRVQYGFVFKKTIPLFWLPAHTITFLLPDEFQVVYAASLSIVLGVLLSLASPKKK